MRNFDVVVDLPRSMSIVYACLRDSKLKKADALGLQCWAAARFSAARVADGRACTHSRTGSTSRENVPGCSSLLFGRASAIRAHSLIARCAERPYASACCFSACFRVVASNIRAVRALRVRPLPWPWMSSYFPDEAAGTCMCAHRYASKLQKRHGGYSSRSSFACSSYSVITLTRAPVRCTIAISYDRHLHA
jgi:hypothetical protein